LEYAQEAAIPEILRQLEDEIPEITVTDVPPPPVTMVEPNDMQIIVPPCHPIEPVKVPDGEQGRSTACFAAKSSPYSRGLTPDERDAG
jgi:hypothetical protein